MAERPSLGSVLLVLVLRGTRAMVRRPVVLAFSFLQPLIWMTFFGFLFQRAVEPAVLGAPDYLTFVAPGVSLLAVLFGASQAGVSLVRDAQTGMLSRMLHTPTPAGWLLLGKLLADVLRLWLAALVVLALGAVLGARLTPDWAHCGAAGLSVCGIALLMASLSCMVAALVRAPEAMGTYVQLVNMPLLFTSSLLVPERALAPWLAELAALNPLSIAAEGWRALWLARQGPSALSVLVLLLASCLAFVLAASALSVARSRE